MAGRADAAATPGPDTEGVIRPTGSKVDEGLQLVVRLGQAASAAVGAAGARVAPFYAGIGPADVEVTAVATAPLATGTDPRVSPASAGEWAGSDPVDPAPPATTTLPFTSIASLLAWSADEGRDCLVRNRWPKPAWAVHEWAGGGLEPRPLAPADNGCEGRCRLLCHDAGVAVHHQDSAAVDSLSGDPGSCGTGLQGLSVVTSGASDAGSQLVLPRWQSCDVFVCFSHARVTVPQRRWSAAANAAGSLCLGTVVTEWGDGYDDTAKFLCRPEAMGQVVDALVRLAGCLGFDGYLLNFETPAPGGAEGASALLAFAGLLRYQLAKKVGSHTRVVWYDSVSLQTGRLGWQSSLTEHNEAAVYSTDGLFLDYHWGAGTPASTAGTLGATLGVPAAGVPLPFLRGVLFGIDVFGRGTFGGGQLQCGVAAQAAVKAECSVALFAPGWAYESVGGAKTKPSVARAREAAMWGDDAVRSGCEDAAPAGAAAASAAGAASDPTCGASGSRLEVPLARPTGDASSWWTIGLANGDEGADDGWTVRWLSLDDTASLGPECPPTGGAGARCAAGDLAWMSFQRNASSQAIACAVADTVGLPSGTARGWVDSESKAAEGAAAPRLERREDGTVAVFSHAWHAMEAAVIVRTKTGAGDATGLQEIASGSLLSAGGSVCFSVRSHSGTSSEPAWVGASLVLCGRCPADALGHCSATPVWHATMCDEALGPDPTTLRLRVPPSLGSRLKAAHAKMNPTSKPRLLLLLRVAGRDSVYWAGHYGTRFAGAWIEYAGAHDKPATPRGSLLAALPRPPARPTLAAVLGVGLATMPLQASFSTGQGCGSGLWLRGRQVASVGSAWAAHALARSGPPLAWEGLSSAGVATLGSATEADTAHQPPWAPLESACSFAASLLASSASGPVIVQTRPAAPVDGPSGSWDGAHTAELIAELGRASGTPVTPLARLFRVRKATAAATIVVRVRWWKESAEQHWAPVPIVTAAAEGAESSTVAFPADDAHADTTCSIPRLEAAALPPAGSGEGSWATALWTLPACREGSTFTLGLALGCVGPASGGVSAEPAATIRLRVGQVSAAEGSATSWPLNDHLEVVTSPVLGAVCALGESAVADTCEMFVGQPRRHLNVELPAAAGEAEVRRTRFEVWRVAAGHMLAGNPDPSSSSIALAAVEDGTCGAAGIDALQSEGVVVLVARWCD